MNWNAADAIARAVLYEGYLLYPYRSSALKNRRRPLFGTIGVAESRELSAECLMEGDAQSLLSARLRFLQDLPDGVVEREVHVDETSLDVLRSGVTQNFDFLPAGGRLALKTIRLGERL